MRWSATARASRCGLSLVGSSIVEGSAPVASESPLLKVGVAPPSTLAGSTSLTFSGASTVCGSLTSLSCAWKRMVTPSPSTSASILRTSLSSLPTQTSSSARST